MNSTARFRSAESNPTVRTAIAPTKVKSSLKPYLIPTAKNNHAIIVPTIRSAQSVGTGRKVFVITSRNTCGSSAYTSNLTRTTARSATTKKNSYPALSRR